MLGEASLAGKFAEEMLAKNIYVIGFSFPVVPKGKFGRVKASELVPGSLLPQ